MPVKTFLNCTMPALVNIRVGSLRGTSGLEATTSWPSRRKNSRNVRLMSLALAIVLNRCRAPGYLPRCINAADPVAKSAVLQCTSGGVHAMLSPRAMSNEPTRPEGLRATIELPGGESIAVSLPAGEVPAYAVLPALRVLVNAMMQRVKDASAARGET